jgi:uncharacterized membrane protein
MDFEIAVILFCLCASLWLKPWRMLVGTELLTPLLATFALLLGAALRRWVAHHPFVYVLGRGFLGSVLCIFAASLLAQWTGHDLPNVSSGLSVIAFWLMAWGDAFITGMMCAIFVAFKPYWLATWSDDLYLLKN